MEADNSGNRVKNVPPFVIDLNESPLPSPRDGGGGTAAEDDDVVVVPERMRGNGGADCCTEQLICGSCGGAAEADGDTLGCCKCRRVFHMRCLGNWERKLDWKCFRCLLGITTELPRACGSGSAVNVGFLDINASPPLEDGEGEVNFIGLESSDNGDRQLNGSKMQAVCDSSFVSHSFNAPVTHSNLLHMGNGFHVQKAARGLTHVTKTGLEDICHRLSFDRKFNETDPNPRLEGRLGTGCTLVDSISPSPSEVYLQALREYISEWNGTLGEGWRVEFNYCQNRCKTFAIYHGPDGSRFESMSGVAHHLGLLPRCHSLEIEERGNEVSAVQNRPHFTRRRKEVVRSLRDSSCGRSQNSPRSFVDRFSSSGLEIVDVQPSSSNDSRSVALLESTNGGIRPPHLYDELPVQFEDFFIMSVGKVDPRPSYHNASQIWPVGYRSCWHDKITGSLFFCDVYDGGDCGPIFKVQRRPCSLQPIPIALTILSRSQSDSSDGKNMKGEGHLASSGMHVDEETSIQMMLAECSPPNLDVEILYSRRRANEDFESRKMSSLTTKFHSPPERSASMLLDNLGLGDNIGEFLVEGRSSSSVWEMVAQTLLHACHDVHKEACPLQFYCKHDIGSRNVDTVDVSDSLFRFCSWAAPTGIPRSIHSQEEWESTCEILVKWLQQDRFGLDVEFVQENIEQLPGVSACSEYKLLDKRSPSSTLRTVRSGFLVSRRRNNLQIERKIDGLFNSKRPKKLEARKFFFPLGKPLSSRLSAHLIGDIVQVWEFLWRFLEVLGLEGSFRFEELEYELTNPWLDSLSPLRKPVNETENNADVGSNKSNQIKNNSLFPNNSSVLTGPSDIPCTLTSAVDASSNRDVTHSQCTRTLLTKAHCSLLKLLVGELLFKVAPVVDPSFDAGEFKPRRNKKKDAENTVTAKKMKLDTLPINELTWPELARRYILAVLSMEGNLDSSEIIFRESGKVFHCLQGDGGLLCGSLAGVAALEADALLLAEAMNQVFGLKKSNNDVFSMDEKSDAESAPKITEVNDSGIPDWAQVLEPVRKLPTNVGARIRRCINEALERNPPDWAKQILVHSISKEVYKGNASGPTKRAVVALLDSITRENLQQNPPEKKEKTKTVGTVSDLIMKKCRIVLRCAMDADEERVFCNLLGRTILSPNDNDDQGLLGHPAMVSRPLDFRTIDLRLAAGAYGGSHEAFLEDVQEVWRNIRIAYRDCADLISLAGTLSQNFEDLYRNEVLAVVHKIRESAVSSCLREEAKKEIHDVLIQVNESSLPKAPWDDGVCKVCGMDKDDDNVLLCDGCDSEYHTYCLNPPLLSIPEGNWYCPPCLSKRVPSRGASCNTQLVSQLGKKRRRSKFTHNHLEGLTQLANTMELKDYWDFSVAERIFLLKFMCDEALNLAIVRDHLDQCVSLSADLQQKLRSLTSELKIQKFKEEILADNMAKRKTNVHNEDGESVLDASASMFSNDGKLIAQLPNRGSYMPFHTGSFVHQEDDPRWNGLNDFNKRLCLSLSKSVPAKPCASNCNHIVRASDTGGTVGDSGKSEPLLSTQPQENDLNGENGGNDLNEPKELNHNNCNGSTLSASQAMPNSISTDGDLHMAKQVDSEIASHGHQSPSQANVNTPTFGLEVSSLKYEISCLQSTIATTESELAKVSVRKELLGRDSGGRLYWSFEGPGSSPQLIVNSSMTTLQSELVDTTANRTTSWKPVTSGAENPLTSRALYVSHSSAPDIGTPVDYSWTSYQSDAEIEELCEWLSDNDTKESELKESILQWQKNKCKGSLPINHSGNENHASSSNISGTVKVLDSELLMTKAATLLLKNYGPCLKTQALKMQGWKAKVTYEGRMYRCQCLEPLGLSRHHCFSCHQMFSNGEELEIHCKEHCSTASPVPLASQFNEDVSKRKKMKGIVKSLDMSSDDLRTVRASRNETHDGGSFPLRYQNEPECPFDYEEIRAKFATYSSLKELVKGIGLIGSNGTPPFVLGRSPYLSDPALALLPSMEKEVNLDNRFMELGSSNISENVANSLTRSPVNGIDDKTAEIDRLRPNCMNATNQFSSAKNVHTLPGKGKCGIHEASLRQLTGRVSEVARRLKMNLLDMEAALPEEALRPSRAHLDRRCAWRGFVKSAECIYQMIQATILLEEMIKAEYLRNEWWYWSSPSAAANVSTLSALALRIYTLDANIIYDKNLPNLDAADSSKPSSQSERAASPNIQPIYGANPSSPPSRKAVDPEAADDTKRSRMSKRKKESGS